MMMAFGWLGSKNAQANSLKTERISADLLNQIAIARLRAQLRSGVGVAPFQLRPVGCWGMPGWANLVSAGSDAFRTDVRDLKSDTYVKMLATADRPVGTHFAILERLDNDDEVRTRAERLAELFIEPIWYGCGGHDALTLLIDEHGPEVRRRTDWEFRVYIPGATQRSEL